jgi:hypothetical protein
MQRSGKVAQCRPSPFTFRSQTGCFSPTFTRKCARAAKIVAIQILPAFGDYIPRRDCPIRVAKETAFGDWTAGRKRSTFNRARENFLAQDV